LSELFRTKSAFHDITVDDNQDGAITLRIGGRRQSTLDSPTGFDAVQPILDYLHLPMAMRPDAQRALIVGLGGGVLPKRMWRDYPGLTIDVAELDPVVVDVARRFFGLPVDDERLTVHVGDGLRFIAETSEVYDIIVVDAYFEDAMPFGFATEEFFASACERLSDRGVLAYNLVSTLEGERTEPLRRFLSGIQSNFAWAGIFPVGVDCGEGRQNIVMAASKSPIDVDQLKASIRNRASGIVTVQGFEMFGDGFITGFDLVQGRPPFRASDVPADGFLRT